MPEYLYQSPGNSVAAERAIIVLPEIFGVTKFNQTAADRLAQELGCAGFALDYFYAVTGKVEVFDYSNAEPGMKIMQTVTGEKFVDIFTSALQEINKSFPKVKAISVLGFCFGGKLALLSGVDQQVNRIASFYGSNPHQPDFYQGQSVVEALAANRQADSDLKVMGLFGADDPSIPEDDRDKTKQLLTEASINYQEKVYSAGHAFMNNNRPDHYVEAVAKLAWADAVAFLKA